MLGLAGRSAEAHPLYQELLERSGTSHVNQAHLAITAWYAGHADAAVEHAGRALESREPLFLLLARHTPDYRDMQADPRFAAIVGELDALPPLAEDGVRS